MSVQQEFLIVLYQKDCPDESHKDGSIMAEVTFQKILITLVAPRKHSAEPDVHKCVIFSRINMAHTVYVVP